MKIDEASINHNTVRLIKSMVWELTEDGMDREKTGNELRIVTIGYIQGVCDLADELKKVLAE